MRQLLDSRPNMGHVAELQKEQVTVLQCDPPNIE
jgi:hypothetical protein